MYRHTLKAWIKGNPSLRRATLLLARIGAPFAPPHTIHAIPRYLAFFESLRRFRRLGGSAQLSDLYPCLLDRTTETAFDPHYLYQAIWAFEKVMGSGAASHVDVGSDSRFVSMLTAITAVTFVDIRPLKLELNNYTGLPGTVLEMPFAEGSVSSLSCLSVVEHVGLGRYGDPIDPMGTEKACGELARVLAPGGHLYLALPVGVERVCFNAHRVVRTSRVIRLMPRLRLVDFSVVNDEGHYLGNVCPDQFDEADFANGLFHFTKDA